MRWANWLPDRVLSEPFLGEQVTIGNVEGIPVYNNVCAHYKVAGPEFLIVVFHVLVLLSLEELSLRNA